MTTEPPRGDWRDALADEGVPADAVAALPAVRAIAHDSRQVRPGDLFVCIPGARADGHDFAAAAVAAGAAALVFAKGRSDLGERTGVPAVSVANPRAALAALAAAHEGYPARRLAMVGITGTDGKSTTAFLTHAALAGAGVTAGLLTTIESRIGGETVTGLPRLTTQEANVVQRLLGDMVAAGCTHAVVEATSHGLELHRLDQCAFDVGVLTNLSSDHLDFHGTMDVYRRAKGRLFGGLGEGGAKAGPAAVRPRAILNADDPSWRYFAGLTRVQAVTYALDADADVRAEDVMLWPDGSTFVVSTGEESVEASVRLPGRFNVANATAAITAAAALGLDARLAASGVAACRGVPGRMEPIAGAPFGVIVDYAHTPDAMRQVLATLRPIVDGRLIVVFGAAGERARDRRSGLGAAVAAGADFAVITEEDPRSEPSDAIVDEIASAMRAGGAAEGERFERVVDRREAIARALAIATSGDLVLVAGKGHEQSIERADGSHPWDDRTVARELIAERFGG
ncbi:MAG: UDP-N-acetylmuramoyl-L-alanyl-D-glutamate--2,6-diaminopimelate ligase [Chloroflexi bacterium]|nr:UDP-N-acetylmuramoyl-L-alanyl-D-glutamate--2,6-diaminopimelate ligase [Chloroflexota bacterium]MQC27607.1 UDP-N-acetylmuramoyl-L-alanyl-D-glutamate--2,6-diaminopimelate ligase [Chloroflexota bacterium]